MSGNPDEMPDADTDSTRLRDRAGSALDRARGESTRLRDEATTAFQRRREQAQQAREAIQERREQFAGALGVAGDLVEPVQLDDRGEEFGFVPTESGEETLAEQFADDRPFVEPSEAVVEAAPREGVLTRTDPAATEAIASRARQDTAADTAFVEPDDLDVAVGPGGVSELGVAESRRDDVRARTRQELAAEDPFANPSDFDVSVSERGVEEAGLSGPGARRRAGRQFESTTDLTSVDPQSDIRETEGGFGLAPPAERELATERLEADTPVTELDPQRDVTRTGDAFGLSTRGQRRVAAEQFDETTPVNVGPDDVEIGADNARLTRETQREIGARQLDQQLPDQTVSASDVELEPTDGGFEAVFER
jgi:hypothetical protein